VQFAVVPNSLRNVRRGEMDAQRKFQAEHAMSDDRSGCLKTNFNPAPFSFIQTCSSGE
jgi:hypothetical protein